MEGQRMPRIIKPAGLDETYNTRNQSKEFIGVGDSRWNEVQHEIDHEVINGRKYWRTAALKDYLKRHTVTVKAAAAGTPRRVHPPPGRKGPTRRKAKAAKGEARDAV
jgi:hypothetical protein